MAYKKTAHRRRRVRSSRRKNTKSRKVMRGGDRVKCTGVINYNGGVYIGQYMADKESFANPLPDTDKFGMITWTNGATYRGQWKNGKKNGVGEMRRRDGIIFKGTWINDNPTGPFEIIIGGVKNPIKIHAGEIDDYGSPGSPTATDDSDVLLSSCHSQSSG
jgi:hypothetical protein